MISKSAMVLGFVDQRFSNIPFCGKPLGNHDKMRTVQKYIVCPVKVSHQFWFNLHSNKRVFGKTLHYVVASIQTCLRVSAVRYFLSTCQSDSLPTSLVYYELT